MFTYIIVFPNFQSTSEYYYNTRCLYPSSYNLEPSTSNGSESTKSFADNLKMKVFEWPRGLNVSYLPTDVDWRTMGAVSDVKDQV